MSLFWALMPLFGWSEYILEDSKTGCCVNYKKRTFNVVSFNLCMILFVFVLPFGFIIIANVKSVFIVSD